MYLDIMKTETALNAGNIQDKVIADNLHEMLNAALQIDKSGLKLAYHAACIKPRLEGNVEGFPTKFEDFAEKKLGVKRAQAFNMLAVGEATERVFDTDIYLDRWTYQNLIADCTAEDGIIEWDKLKKLARSRKTLGTTKVLTALRLLNKYDMTDDDIRAYIADRKNSAYSNTVKEFEKALKEPFNLLPDKNKTEDKTEGKTEDKTEDKTEGKVEEKTEGKVEEKTYSIPESVVDDIYPELCRVSAECPKLAVFVDMLNKMGFKEKVAK